MKKMFYNYKEKINTTKTQVANSNTMNEIIIVN